MRNLWASNSGRNPSIGWNGVFNFVNNVVFNWVHRSSDGGDYTAMFNMINNYYKPGPATPKDTPVGHRILKPEAGRSKLDHKVYGRVYADGNIMEGYPAITEDNWAGGIQIETQPNTEGYTENMRSNRPFEMPYIRITSAHDAYDFVLKNAGANIPCRDIVDERIIEEVRTGIPYYDKKMAKDANGDLTDWLLNQWEKTDSLNIAACRKILISKVSLPISARWVVIRIQRNSVCGYRW